jgi:glycopeptide antibiotics resistance protein
MFLRHPILSAVTFAYLAIVGWLTLSPQAPSKEDSLFWRIALFFDGHAATAWITFNRLEFAANLAMFIPIGLFFVLLLGRRRWWLAVALGVALTIGIEFGQQFIPSRVSDPRDILSNSSGAIVGVIAALVITAGKARRMRVAAYGSSS